MSEEQIKKEILEIEKDESLTFNEKKIYFSIYNAELERQKFDKYIKMLKEKIQDLRIKIIDDIINIYPSLDEVRKEKASIMLYSLGLAASTTETFKVDDFIAEHEVVSDSIKGSITLYLDNNIHEKLEKLNNMHRNFLRSIDRKYITLEEKLSDILDPEVFNFTSQENPEEYKDQKDFDAIFIKENNKIIDLNIYIKAKTILRNILMETIKYGKSYGKMYEQFDDKTDYVNQKMSELEARQTM